MIHFSLRQPFMYLKLAIATSPRRPLCFSCAPAAFLADKAVPAPSASPGRSCLLGLRSRNLGGVSVRLGTALRAAVENGFQKPEERFSAGIGACGFFGMRDEGTADSTLRDRLF